MHGPRRHLERPGQKRVKENPSTFKAKRVVTKGRHTRTSKTCRGMCKLCMTSNDVSDRASVSNSDDDDDDDDDNDPEYWVSLVSEPGPCSEGICSSSGQPQTGSGSTHPYTPPWPLHLEKKTRLLTQVLFPQESQKKAPPGDSLSRKICDCLRRK